MVEKMSRYIDIEPYEKDGWYLQKHYHNSFGEVIKTTPLVSVPTAEAEPVKYGRWIWNKRLGEWYCSNCDRIMTPYIVEKSEGEYEMAQPFYCGWCGAKMDEVEE